MNFFFVTSKKASQYYLFNKTNFLKIYQQCVEVFIKLWKLSGVIYRQFMLKVNLLLFSICVLNIKLLYRKQNYFCYHRNIKFFFIVLFEFSNVFFHRKHFSKENIFHLKRELMAIFECFAFR